MILQLLKIALILGGIFLAYKLIMRFTTGGSGGGFKCRNCINCKSLFDDGVLCRYGAKEVFKNSVHIENCQDYQRG